MTCFVNSENSHFFRLNRSHTALSTCLYSTVILSKYSFYIHYRKVELDEFNVLANKDARRYLFTDC